MKKDASRPNLPIRNLKVVLDSWNEIGRKLTGDGEDFPEDKYDFQADTPRSGASPSSCCTRAGSCYYLHEILRWG